MSRVAEKNPRGWYRTIDRIYPALTCREKLPIPDIKGDASIVYEEGKLYPHHNLYFITSDEWDVHALQAVSARESHACSSRFIAPACGADTCASKRNIFARSGFRSGRM